MWWGLSWQNSLTASGRSIMCFRLPLRPAALWLKYRFIARAMAAALPDSVGWYVPLLKWWREFFLVNFDAFSFGFISNIIRSSLIIWFDYGGALQMLLHKKLGCGWVCCSFAFLLLMLVMSFMKLKGQWVVVFWLLWVCRVDAFLFRVKQCY